MRPLRPLFLFFATTLSPLILTTPATAQSLNQGDQTLSVDTFILTRSDGAMARNATGIVASHTYQFSSDWQFITQLGITTTATEVTAAGSTATQETDAGSVGVGISYTGLRGGTLSAVAVYGQIDETNVIFTPSQSAGDVLGLSLAYQQFVPITYRLLAIADISVALTEGTVTTPSTLFLDDAFSRRYSFAGALAYAATPDLTLIGGVDYTTSNQVLTITGDTELTRATLGANWSFSDQLDLRVSYSEALEAEDTHNMLSLGLTHRF